MEDPAKIISSSTPQDDLNQTSPQPTSVPEPPVTPPPPLPETPPAPAPEKSEPPSVPRQLEETPPPIPVSTEAPLVFRNPEEKGGNKPRKPYLIGGAILMFLVFSSALAYYFFQKGGFGIQKKAEGCPPSSCTGSGYLCAGSCDCNWNENKGVKWHYKCVNGSIEKYNEFDSSCDSACGGGGGGGGRITCGADGSGIWVKNTGTSSTTIAVSWFASYCDRTDCFCGGGPSNENFTLQPGQTISRGFTNSHPACKWSWQTDVTAGSCHQSAHGCGSETCVSPTPIPPIVTGIATGTIPSVCCCQVGELFHSVCAQVQPCTWKSPLLCKGTEEPRDAVCCTAPTSTPKPTSTPPPVPPTRPPATPTPTTPLLACVDVQVAVAGGGSLSSLKIGDSLSFTVSFGGTVQDVGIVIKKEGIRVKTFTAVGSQTNSWTSPSYTIDSLGSYEILGYIKTNGVWR